MTEEITGRVYEIPLAVQTLNPDAPQEMNSAFKEMIYTYITKVAYVAKRKFKMSARFLVEIELGLDLAACTTILNPGDKLEVYLDFKNGKDKQYLELDEFSECTLNIHLVVNTQKLIVEKFRRKKQEFEAGDFEVK